MVSLPSFSIPIRRHFWNRQAWHAFLRRFVISHMPFAGQEYSIFPEIRNVQILITQVACNQTIDFQFLRFKK